QQQVVIGVDLYERMIACRDALIAHAAGHTDAFFQFTAEAAIGGAGGDCARGAVLALSTVRRGLTAKVVALHDALSALALAGSDDVDELDVVEQLDGDGVAGIAIGGILETDLAEVLPGSNTGLGSVAD